MKPQEIIDIATTATNTMQEGIDMLRALRLENDKLKSLAPKWRDISEIDGVEDGTLVAMVDFLSNSIVYNDIGYLNDFNRKFHKEFTHFIVLPKP